MLGAAKDVEDKGVRLRVLAARAAAAEAACPQGRTFADPTIHNPSRSPNRRAQPGLNIMRRARPARKQREVSERVAPLQRPERAAAHRHLGSALADDVVTVADVTLLEDDLASWHPPRHQARGDPV